MTSLPRRLHLVGVGGGGLAPLAGMLAAEGHVVSGCDSAASFDPDSLAAAGVAARRGHDAGHVRDVDLVVRSAAVSDAHPELLAARAAGLPVLKYAEVLGLLSETRPTLAVAGTHGKTTTTALVAHLLEQAGRSPGWIVGGRPLSLPSPARWGKGGPLVIEACEYDLSFLHLCPEVALINSIAPDHLDCFGTAEAVTEAFARFAGRLRPGGTLVLGRSVPAAFASFRPEGVRCLQAGTDLACDELSEGPTGFVGRIANAGFRLPLLGRHNLDNLLAALLVVDAAGLPWRAALPHVESFAGVARRLQDLGEHEGVRIVDDFAHHPDALEAAATALRARYPGRSLVGVFQPHQVSRTADFLDDFARALARFDRTLLCDIFVARDAEPQRAAVLAEALVARAGGTVRRVGPAVEAEGPVRAALRAGDVCVVMGAGDIDGLAARLAGAPPGPGGS